jgi:muconolactone D-isomerase
MEFLVRISIGLPWEMPQAQRDALTAAEATRGLELRQAGTINRIWRVPGRRVNVGIWHAADATQLHDALASLPLFEFADIDVTPLATHYLEAGT